MQQITTPVRQLDDQLWAIFAKKGPLTAEEQAYLDRIEAEYEEVIFDEEEHD
jgi:hypothetical protein